MPSLHSLNGFLIREEAVFSKTIYVMNEQKYDSDIRETIENLLKQNDVQDALCFVKDTLPETIEIQKELALIEAPTFHEEKKAKRYAELLPQVP